MLKVDEHISGHAYGHVHPFKVCHNVEMGVHTLVFPVSSNSAGGVCVSDFNVS